MEKVRLLKVGIIFSALSFAGATLVSGSAGRAQDTGTVKRVEAIKKELLKNLEDEKRIWRFFIPGGYIARLKDARTRLQSSEESAEESREELQSRSETAKSNFEQRTKELEIAQNAVIRLEMIRDEKENTRDERQVTADELEIIRNEKENTRKERERTVTRLTGIRNEKENTRNERQATVNELETIRNEKENTRNERQATVNDYLSDQSSAQNTISESERNQGIAQDAIAAARATIFKSSAAEEIDGDLTNLRSYRHEDAGGAFRVVYREAEEETPAAYFDISAAGSGINTDTTMADLAGMIQALINEQGGTLTDFIAKKTDFGTAEGALGEKSTELSRALDTMHYMTGEELGTRRSTFERDYSAYNNAKTPYRDAYTRALSVSDDAFDIAVAEARSGEIKTTLADFGLQDTLTTVPTGAPRYAGRLYEQLTKAELLELLDDQSRYYGYYTLRENAKSALTAFATARGNNTTHTASGGAQHFASFENFGDLTNTELAAFFGYRLNTEEDFDNYGTAPTFAENANDAQRIIDMVEELPDSRRTKTISMFYSEINNYIQNIRSRFNAEGISVLSRRGVVLALIINMRRIKRSFNELDARRRFTHEIQTHSSDNAKITYMARVLSTHLSTFTEVRDLIARFNSGASISKTMTWLVDALTNLKNSDAFRALDTTRDDYNQYVASGSRPVDLSGLKEGLTTETAIEELKNLINTANLPNAATLGSLQDLVAKYDGYVAALQTFKDRYTGVADDAPSPDELRTTIETAQTALGEYNDAKDDEERADEALSDAKAALERALEDLSGETDLDADEVVTAKLQENLEAIRALLNKMEGDGPDDDTDTDESLTLEQLSRYLGNLKNAQNDLRTAEGKLRDAQGKLREAQNNLPGARADLETARADLKTARADLETAQGKLGETKDELKQAKGKLAVAENRLSEAKGKLAVAENKLKKAQVELKKAQNELNTAQGKLAVAENKLGEAQTARDKAEGKKIELAQKLARGGQVAENKANYERLLTGMTQHVTVIQNRLTEFALLDTLWQHSTMTGGDGFSLEIDTAGSWLTHLLGGAIGDAALTVSYRSGNFHVNLTANYAISYFRHGLENIEWVTNDLAAGTLKLGYHSNVGLRGNIYLSRGSTIMSETRKWMYGAGGHLAYTVWLQDFEPSNFTISLTPSLQIDGALTRETTTSSALSYAKAELGFTTGLHKTTPPPPPRRLEIIYRYPGKS